MCVQQLLQNLRMLAEFHAVEDAAAGADLCSSLLLCVPYILADGALL